MRRYLLDTGALAALMNDRPGATELMLPWVIDREATTSALVYAELIEYLKPRANFEERREALRGLLRSVYVYFLTFQILETYADIRLQLRRPYGPGLIGDIDTLIAATALERELSVVTIDSNFLRVPGLPVILLDRRDLTVVERREN